LPDRSRAAAALIAAASTADPVHDPLGRRRSPDSTTSAIVSIMGCQGFVERLAPLSLPVLCTVTTLMTCRSAGQAGTRSGPYAHTTANLGSRARALSTSSLPITIGPHLRCRAVRLSADHPFLRRYDHHADPSESEPYRRVGARSPRHAPVTQRHADDRHRRGVGLGPAPVGLVCLRPRVAGPGSYRDSIQRWHGHVMLELPHDHRHINHVRAFRVCGDRIHVRSGPRCACVCGR
jgi:hypothetical protein